MDKDPNSVEQHGVGAKLDLGKPAALLCLSDFGPALRELVNVPLDFLRSATAIEEACATVLLDEWMGGGGISGSILLAAMVAVQFQAGQLDRGALRLDSVHGVVSAFPDALLAIASLTAIGANKYRPSGWKDVPEGVQRYSEACARHLLRSFIERDDPDTGATHWCCVAWNAAAVLTLRTEHENRKSGHISTPPTG